MNCGKATSDDSQPAATLAPPGVFQAVDETRKTYYAINHPSYAEGFVSDLERISITIEPELLARIDAFVARSGHSNRSKAMGDLLRAGLIEREEHDEEGVAVVALTYDHEKRELPERLVHLAHGHEGMVLATTHLHLDARNCLEMSALRGPLSALRHYAEHIAGLKGVHHSGFVVARPVP